MKKITVFTATYNRAFYLERLYESLINQTFFDFEWIVVDDGSTDDTELVIKSIIDKKPFFEIKYLKTENGGKHRAINRGIHLADGELVLIMDSDDWLLKEALETIDYYSKSIPLSEKNNFAGVYGLRIHSNGEIVGKSFVGEYLDCTYIERGKYNIIGDKCEVYYTSLLKQIRFPEFEGENFCTECLVWDKIGGMGLKIRFFNKAIYVSDYLDGGLTKEGNRLYANNPKQYGMFVKNEFLYNKSDKFHASIKIYEYYLFEKNKLSFKEIADNLCMNRFIVTFYIVVQWFADIFRYLFKKGKTIKKSVRRELDDGNK